MKKIALIAGMGLMPLLAAQAQQDSTLNRTVVVENLYNPTVMDASKINVLPKVEEPTVPKTRIDYVTSLRPLTDWKYQEMQPIVREWQPDAACRGYLRGGYGNNGNVDARLGYVWDISKKDRLNLAASLDGWNGNVKDLNDMDWKSRLYNTRIGLDYKHVFRQVDFKLGGYYRSQVFNYMPGQMYDATAMSRSSVYHQRQHQTMGNVHLGFASNDENMSIRFFGEIGMDYFKQKYPVRQKAPKEIDLYVKGDIGKSFDGQFLGLSFDFDHFSYSFDDYTYLKDDVKDATSLELNPYYTFVNDDWRIRLGAHVDWWNSMEDEVNFAPDVNVEYVFSDSYVLYATAGGGRENKSLMELTDITPYWGLRKPYLVPTYKSLDASIGLKASPADGWWFNLTGGYQIRKNDLFWTLNQGIGSNLFFVQGQSKLLYGSAELKYDYKDLFDLALKATSYHWETSEIETFDELDEYGQKRILALKPELEIKAEVGFKPMEGLRVNVGYEYMKRCEDVYDPVSNLYAGADYTLLKNLSVFAEVNNLLNKEYVRPDAYPAQKLNFLAGVSLQF